MLDNTGELFLVLIYGIICFCLLFGSSASLFSESRTSTRIILYRNVPSLVILYHHLSITILYRLYIIKISYDLHLFL